MQINGAPIPSFLSLNSPAVSREQSRPPALIETVSNLYKQKVTFVPVVTQKQSQPAGLTVNDALPERFVRLFARVEPTSVTENQALSRPSIVTTGVEQYLQIAELNIEERQQRLFDEIV